MKKLILALLLTFAWALPLMAQQTTVTGTVTDPNGIAYSNGTYKVTLLNNTSFQPLLGGLPLSPTQYTGSMDVNGNLSLNMIPNSSITVGGATTTQWTFSICANGAQIAFIYPPPTLPCFSFNVTITGSSQSITSNITAAPVATVPLPKGVAAAVVPSSSNPAIPGPPVFNVKNYGASGNSVLSSNCTISGSTNLNCTDLTFTAANVGQRVSCAINHSTMLNPTTIAAFVNATNVTLTAGAGNNTGTCLIGSADDTGITAALTAALAAQVVKSQAGNLSPISAAPVLYLPAGAYNLLNTDILINGASGGLSGFTFKGDGYDQTKLYWNTTSTNANGAFLQCNNFSNVNFENFTMDGALGAQTASNAAFLNSCNGTTVRLVVVQNFGVAGLQSGGSIYANRLQVVGNTGNGIFCNGCNGEMYESGSSNNGNSPNLLIQNVTGLNGGSGFRWVNGLIDECGSANGCTRVINSSDVWFQGAAMFGGSPSALTVDGTSFLHWEGGIAGPFGNDSNIAGVQIAAGGVLQAQDVRFVSSGTGTCIANSGSLFDNGGNTCENMYTISSGTSTGTTAVLTLTNHGAAVNTNCSVGDALYVQGAGIVGYNGYHPAGATTGITATSATTLTYTTAGSNLGVLGAGGTAFCRNLQTYTGNLPKALLNNPIPNTCYITGTFAATTTAAPMCAFSLGSATNVNQIKATSTTTTACTVAPVVTITDGAVSETLTITTAKSIWDSSVDTSTGVGTTIFKPNGTITLSNTAGTCTTPPTNFSVSYNISPILSN